MTYGVPGILKPAFQRTREEVRKIGEFQSSAEIFVEILLNGGAVVVKTDFYIVLVDLPRKVVDELIVTVHPVAGKAVVRTKLSERKTVYVDDGQTRIGDS